MAERRKRSDTLKSRSRGVSTGEIVDVLKNLVQSVDRTLSTAIAPPKAEANAGSQGQQQRSLSESVEQNLNPIQNLVLKNIDKGLKEPISEAIQLKGALAVNDITDQFGISLNGLPERQIPQREKAIQALDNVVSSVNNQQQRILQPQNLFTRQRITPEGDLQLGGFFDFTGQPLENLIKAQQITGQVPLQKGEREKIRIEQFNQLATGSSKPLSSEAAKTLANVNSGLKQITALEEGFLKDSGIFRTTGLSATGQAVNTMIQDLSDILGRLRSGGAINVEEEKRFRKQLPAKGFIRGALEKPSTVKLKLQKLRELFNDIKTSVTPNEGSDLTQRIQAAREAGFSDKDIMQRLQKQGVLQ